MGLKLPGRLKSIVNTLSGNPPVRSNSLNVDYDELESFTTSDVIDAARFLPNRNAPGSDMISNKVVKAAVIYDLDILHGSLIYIC